MEQAIVTSAPSRKVKTLRITALTLFFIVLFPFWNNLIEWYWGSIYYDSSWYLSPQFVIWRIVFPVIHIAAIGILALLASDRQTKFAVILWASVRLILAVAYIVMESTRTPVDLSFIALLFYLTQIYSISIVLSKNQCETNSWIALLLLYVPVNMAEYFFVMPYIYPSMLSTIWGVIINVLIAIAYYHMTYSNVFSGPETSDAAKTEMPLMSVNRYFWIVLAVSVFVTAVFWVYNAYVSPLFV